MKDLLRLIIDKAPYHKMLVSIYKSDYVGSSEPFRRVFDGEMPLGQKDVLTALSDVIPNFMKVDVFNRLELINICLFNLSLGRDIHIEERFPIYLTIKNMFYSGYGALAISDITGVPYISVQKMNPILKKELLPYSFEDFCGALSRPPLPELLEDYLFWLYCVEIGSKPTLAYQTLHFELLKSGAD